MDATHSSPTFALETEDFRGDKAVRAKPRLPVLKVSPPHGETQNLPQKIFFAMAHARARMNPRLRHHGALKNERAVRQDLEQIGGFKAQIVSGTDITDACLGFLSKLTLDAQRKAVVPEFLEIAAGTLRKNLMPTKAEIACMDRLTKLFERATAIRTAKNAEARAELCSFDSVKTFFGEVFPS